MDSETTDTICAPASGSGKAGIAVFRISGPNALGVLRRLTGRSAFEPRRVYRAEFSDPASGEVVDDGLALYFPAPNSFTGEDVAEIHVHGGRAVAAGMLSAITAVGGAAGGVRLAEPGEFTRRAFMNGKMDLTAAEALADLVDAETTAQRRQARRQLSGALGDLCLDWRARLVQAIAWFEAEIDFSDEDLPGGLAARTADEIGAIRGEIQSRLADRRTGERIRDGLRVAIVGPPNAGKSTLLNGLAGRDAAIVSATAGTTRDVIEVHLDLGGYAVILADTAGIRAPGDAPWDAPWDPIEAEGVRRAARTAEEADVRLVVLDGAAWPEVPTGAAGRAGPDDLVVLNKCDLIDSGQIKGDPAGGELNPPPLPASALHGHGMDLVVAELTRRVSRLSGGGEAPVVTRARHRAALEQCAEALTRFDPYNSSELAAEDLRLAARSLGRVIGEIDVEDILDVIFRDFCIGK
ncbi:MAG: tRNA uridine-5-carboxymethylaminomethyl(34) synthesis GTPase MnmE [Rhodospirillales bacterium]|nr:tRNA uridine-5-carboxymethylaminomethyl(34) synthesis GTPase MnmE [Rhodospirillales bacterium]